MYRIASLLFTLLPLSAAAAPDLGAAYGDWRTDELLQGEPPAEPASTPGRAYDMEVNFRGRFLSVPNMILDIWYFSADPDVDPDSPAPVERPSIRAYALGLEFVTKKDSANGVFYFEFIDSLMPSGYWDDREGVNGEDHLDGEYIIPSDNLGIVAFGANYAYEAFFVRTEDTNGNFGLSLLVGGGLGLGIMVGKVEYLAWSDETGQSALERHEEDPTATDGKKPGVPPVAPMVDLNAALRFNFGDRFVLRVEGGLHTMIYYGATLGIMF